MAVNKSVDTLSYTHLLSKSVIILPKTSFASILEIQSRSKPKMPGDAFAFISDTTTRNSCKVIAAFMFVTCSLDSCTKSVKKSSSKSAGSIEYFPFANY